MASKVIVEEEMELPGDSTVEYLGTSMEYESDGSSEFPSSVMSSSEGDSDDSDGSSVDGTGTEEIVTEGDDGNYDNDSWKCTGEDCSADELLDRYTFSPPAVGGHPRNCIPPDSRPGEYVCMWSRGTIFYLFSSNFLADEKCCIFCPVGGNVSGFLSSNGEFCLVFKYVHVYI